MELSSSDKTAVLLHVLKDQIDAIERRESREQTWFEWATNLLLATFGATVALAGKAASLPYPIVTKVLATALVTIPSGLIVSRILTSRKRQARNAKTVERIQQLLHLFEEGYYGTHSPYPNDWAGNLAKGILRRKTPLYFAAILALMASCVVVAIWLLL